MVAQYAREAEFLLEEGATPEQVDAGDVVGQVLARSGVVEKLGLKRIVVGGHSLGGSIT